MALKIFFGTCATLAVLLGCATAHGGQTAHQKPIQIDPEADWATRHMAEEHHISNFDAGSFFSLHDFDDDGVWEPGEILKMYGMEDPSAKDVPESKKDEVVQEILKMLDKNDNGVVEREEYMRFSEQEERTLPDFGLGPGHHWDMETEYEIHHWEKYHDENTKLEDLTHPEDIEHFKLHDDLEDEQNRVAALDKLAIVEQNIPRKFRRDGQ